MRGYRLSRSLHTSYDGEGAKRAGGRWNSKGTRVLYMSESRALCVLEVLVHLTDTLPDKYVLGEADIPPDLGYEAIPESTLSPDWKTPSASEQGFTRQMGDDWVRRGNSAVLLVPSVIVGENNILCNPAHREFGRIRFSEPISFAFDDRLFRAAWTTNPIGRR